MRTEIKEKLFRSVIQTLEATRKSQEKNDLDSNKVISAVKAFKGLTQEEAQIAIGAAYLFLSPTTLMELSEMLLKAAAVQVKRRYDECINSETFDKV